MGKLRESLDQLLQDSKDYIKVAQAKMRKSVDKPDKTKKKKSVK